MSPQKTLESSDPKSQTVAEFEKPLPGQTQEQQQISATTPSPSLVTPCQHGIDTSVGFLRPYANQYTTAINDYLAVQEEISRLGYYDEEFHDSKMCPFYETHGNLLNNPNFNIFLFHSCARHKGRRRLIVFVPKFQFCLLHPRSIKG